MTVGAVLTRIAGFLETAEIPFMLAGSFASTVHGMPRSTYDIDLVIDPPTSDALDGLVRALPPDAYYVDLDAAREAYRRRSMFNVIDIASGWKVDLILRKQRAFSIEEFRRRQTVSIEGVALPAATAEDTIVAKLDWSARGGGSERQRRDVAGILATTGDSLDRVYIERWVTELSLQAEWAEAQKAQL